MLQLTTPDEMRGRVSSVNSLFISSSNELGAFYAGMTKFGLSAFGAVTIFGLVVAGTMELIRRWQRHNVLHHPAEMERLLAIARRDDH